jgi:hypothetical protein
MHVYSWINLQRSDDDAYQMRNYREKKGGVGVLGRIIFVCGAMTEFYKS